MYKYNLAFIQSGDFVLMLNRNKSPWMGSWNGVGGKLEEGETAIESVIREIYEETNIVVTNKQVNYKGVVTWNVGNGKYDGLYLYHVNVDSSFIFSDPIKTKEGILDWKKIDWISDFDNYGVCDNIPYFINSVLFDNKIYNHICEFNDKILVSVKKEVLE